MKYTNWTLSPCSPSALKAMQEAGIPPLTAAVLCARGIETPEQARAFLRSDLSLLHDPMLMKDMDHAAERIRKALDQGETIAVYGDYDVDGITSTALLTSYLRGRGARTIAYIPDRLEEGYGLNNDAVRRLHSRGVSLIITVDCGITAVEETELAHRLGMDVVITDHHECREILPAAVAVVNPHRPDCGYPFEELAGVGVALKLVMAVAGPAEHRRLLEEYGDLAAIGTIADVMELTDENRAITAFGLRLLRQPRRPGLQMLLRESGLDGKSLTATSISYTIAPRINASGRMGRADLACELLLTRDLARAEDLARTLCALNRDRQSIETGIYLECLARLSRCRAEDMYSIVLADENWHQGVVGIVASRLCEKFSCPVFMICLSDGKGKGSCRSFGGVNLFHALEQCADLLDSFGGHEQAAGFTIREENISLFRSRVDACIRQAVGDRPLTADLAVEVNLSDASLLTLENVASLGVLEPTGAGNPRPVFQLTGAMVTGLTAVGNGRHSRFRLSRDGVMLDAILFGAAPRDAGLSVGARVDVAFTPNVNEFRGNRTVQLQILDVRPALTQLQAEQLLYRRWRRGEVLTPQEVASMIPRREDFAAVWRYLVRHTDADLVEETGPRLARRIARTYGIREAYSRTMICLDVMDERGLITVCAETDHLQIRVLPASGKVNLEESAIMIELKKRLNQS